MKRAGYTLIEVMTAVVVMTIGATGIVAMQGASVRANQDANETSNAVNFATTWIERIKRDARSWNAIGSNDLAAGNNKWLNTVTTGNGAWFVPTTTAPEQPAADINGFDTASEFTVVRNGDPLAFFCANVRLTAVQAFDPAAPTVFSAAGVSAIRADVRVWWYRNSNDADRTALACRTRALGAVELNADGTSWRFRKTYLSNMVTWRTLGWP
jgi:prepilin-type N-terminal cleavage/methylation domain-containing protein